MQVMYVYVYGTIVCLFLPIYFQKCIFKKITIIKAFDKDPLIQIHFEFMFHWLRVNTEKKKNHTGLFGILVVINVDGVTQKHIPEHTCNKVAGKNSHLFP